MTAAGNGTSRRSPWNLYSVEYIKPNQHHPKSTKQSIQNPSQPYSPSVLAKTPEQPSTPPSSTIQPPSAAFQPSPSGGR